MPQLRRAALRADEHGYEHAGAEEDQLHYEAALPESPRSRHQDQGLGRSSPGPPEAFAHTATKTSCDSESAIMAM